MYCRQAAARPSITQPNYQTTVEAIDARVTNRPGSLATFSFDDIIGESERIRNAVTLGKRFACSRENVLLIGESGTGKELFAQSIHNLYCPEGPFIAVNCAATPRSLIESELFGYEAGSFTGAERGGRPGKIELANGGTLFLDEIGDMPLELQAVLLRVLEDKLVMRVGGRRYKQVNFRLITATNKNLEKMMQADLFREDLYFRLSVLPIELPPLRERADDTERLSKYFLNSYCKKAGWNVPEFSSEAMNIINKCKWPGNVRQLKNAVIYAVNTTQSDMIQPDDLPAFVLNNDTVGSAAGRLQEAVTVQTIKQMERLAIQNALYRTANDVARAAKMLDIGRATLYRKMKEYEINMKCNVR